MVCSWRSVGRLWLLPCPRRCSWALPQASPPWPRPRVLQSASRCCDLPPIQGEAPCWAKDYRRHRSARVRRCWGRVVWALPPVSRLASLPVLPGVCLRRVYSWVSSQLPSCLHDTFGLTRLAMHKVGWDVHCRPNHRAWQRGALSPIKPQLWQLAPVRRSPRPAPGGRRCDAAR